MSVLSAVIQAIIQGLSEFLPISSSGHLSLYQHFTGNDGEGALLFSAILHLGTLVAVFVAFRMQILVLIAEFFAMIKDIFTGKFTFRNMEPARRVIFMFIISTAVLLPFFVFKDFFTSFSEDKSILAESICFIYTACILFMADKSDNGNKTITDVRLPEALTIGFFQGVALLPGVSRSGSTISGGIFSGLKRSEAVSYSFILGIPAILGGCLVELKDGIQAEQEINVLNCVVGFVVAAIVGLLAIKLVQWLMKSDKFKIFYIYTFILGVIMLGIAIAEIIVGHQFIIG